LPGRDTHGYADRDAHGRVDGDIDRDPHGRVDVDTDCDPHGRVDSDTDRDAHGHVDRDSRGYADSHAHRVTDFSAVGVPCWFWRPPMPRVPGTRQLLPSSTSRSPQRTARGDLT
jgi:hypothetical protein